jgi:hypothetical protein
MIYVFLEKFGTVAHTGNAACPTDLCTTGLCAGVQTTLRNRGTMDVYGIRDANNEVRTRVPMLIGLLLLLLLAGCTSAPATQSEQAQSAEPRDDVVAGASIAKIATKSGPSGAKVSASPPSKKEQHRFGTHQAENIAAARPDIVGEATKRNERD